MSAGPGQPSAGGGRHKRRRGRRPPGRARQEHQGIFTAPMDHSYRGNMGSDNGNGSRGPRRPGFSASYPVVDPEPLPAPREAAASRVFAFVEDLFFLSKIQATGQKMNVKVE